MDDCVSLELVLAAIGHVGFSGLRFLLCASPEKVSGGKLHAVRTRDSHEHVSILVVYDVSHSILTEWVADLTIDAPGFPGYESPSTNERIRCHRLFLQGQCLRFLPCPAIERSTPRFHYLSPQVHGIGFHVLMMADGATSPQAAVGHVFLNEGHMSTSLHTPFG